MGIVVQLDPAVRKRTSGTRTRRRPRKRSKSALVLGGGGLTGGVYEVGALRALDLLAVDGSINAFDVYVGTSAGAFVAAMAANGITPEEMMRVVTGHDPSPYRHIDLGQLLRPNLRELVAKGVALPWHVAGLLRELGPRLGSVSLMDVALGLAEALPSGMYTASGIEAYVRTVLSDPDRSDDFRVLRRELYLPATDLDTCERIVLGGAGWDDVPISRAVSASAALPMVYRPVEVRERELVDGGIVSTTNIDVAVAAGATLVVVINPIVPFVNDFSRSVGSVLGRRPRHVSDMGIGQVGYQAFKLVAHQRLHEMSKQWQERYPGVDIVLIEPERDDELMFQTSMMDWTKRVEIARHGFESVTLRLAAEYDGLRAVCDRHGIEISPERVRRVVAQAGAEEPERTAAWRRILEQTTGALLRQSP